MNRFHCHPIGPDIGQETPNLANDHGLSYPTPIPKLTTRCARGTETRRRGSRESEIGSNLVCAALTSLIANLRFARTAYLGRKRRGIPSTFANSCPPPYSYGGNLSVIPSQESPQIHAISPPSLRVSVVRSPLLYKTLVIHVLLRLSHKYLPMAVTTVGDLLNGLALTAKTCRHVLYGGAVVQNDGEDFSHIHGFQP